MAEQKGDVLDELSLPQWASADCITAVALARAMACWRSGDLGGGISLAETAVLTYCDRCNEPCGIYASLMLALFLSYARRVEAARQILDQLATSADVQADPKLMAAATLVSAQAALAAGDLAAAAALAETGLQHASEVGLTAWTPLGHIVMLTTALRRGDLGVAIHYTGQLGEDAVFAREAFPSGQSAWAVVQITEAKKGRERAAALAHELLESESLTRRLLISEPAALPWLVRLMVSVGERDLASQGVRFSWQLAAENPTVHSIAAAALHAAALLDEDLDKLRRAAESQTDRWARASAIEDIGVLLSEGREESPEAAENFELALRSYAEMGSLRDLARVRSRLRHINANPPSQAGLRPFSGVAGLTGTEYAVARLVSHGLTNGEAAEQLFLSRHTVAFHLRKVFQKMCVKSRLELAVMWNDLDTGAPIRS